MDARLTVETGRRKHTFGKALDSELAFADHAAMHRSYVRRRVVVVAAALVLAAMLGGRVAGALTPPPSTDQRPTRVYVVQDGDTLWTIASVMEPGSDPRETVEEIERLNGGLSGPLVAGRTLVLPVPR